jgi:hypothetical protein
MHLFGAIPGAKRSNWIDGEGTGSISETIASLSPVTSCIGSA